MDTDEATTAGARWVDRYLMPLLAQRMGLTGDRRLRCLQIEPDNEDEATRLRELGHECCMVRCDPSAPAQPAWRQPPAIVDLARLPFADASFDFLFTGAFGRIAGGRDRRKAVAREMARVCRTDGAVLLTVGNRHCPLDLSASSPRPRVPWSPTSVTFRQMRRLFVDECGFSDLRPLSLAGIFGWSSARGIKRMLARCLDRYLRWSSRPSRPGIYASPLNPVLALWIER